MGRGDTEIQFLIKWHHVEHWEIINTEHSSLKHLGKV